MTECKHIQEKLSAFLEGVLSPDEKRRVREHLASCRHCSEALEDLKKVVHLVRSLEEVEPPPWFTQKVMSRVREGAEGKKRALIARLFYPLQVKVPIQALASVLIVVLALYVYRSVEPEVKFAKAPSEVARQELAAPKNQAGRSHDKAGAGTPAPEITSVPEEWRERAAGRIAAVPGAEAVAKPATKEPPAPAGFAPEPAKAKEHEAAADGQLPEMKAAAPSPSQQEPPQLKKAPSPLARRDAESTVSAGAQAEMKQERGRPVPQAAGEARLFATKKAELTGFALHVNDVTSAAGEIRKLLGQLGARSVASESQDGTTVITADLAAQKLEEFARKLPAFGRVEEKGAYPATAEGSVSIRIEIIPQ
jgi:anti-sigma factor RsiW